jgi:hypothetical protein
MIYRECETGDVIEWNYDELGRKLSYVHSDKYGNVVFEKLYRNKNGFVYAYSNSIVNRKRI